MNKKAEEAPSIYSKGFVVGGTFIDFISVKPVDIDEEKARAFSAQIGKKMEELNKHQHSQQ